MICGAVSVPHMKSSARTLFLICTLAGSSLAQQMSPSEAAFALDEIMAAQSAAGNFSGVVLVGEEGKVLYQRAFGFGNLEWKIPNGLDTKFEIGSMTKQFTALLVLQMVNEGKLTLDGHITDYLPYYRKDTGSRVNVSELLSHTSGIPNFIAEPGFLEGPASRTKYSVKEFVEKHCSGDLHFDPGSKFEYSNSGYFLLGAILEQVSGESYEQMLSQRIFRPLAMRDSGYARPETVIVHRAAGYERVNDGLQNARFYDMSIPFAAGALYSTVGDLFRWDQALYTDQLLPKPLREMLFKPNLENYGFGWGILIPKEGAPNAGEKIEMHGGAISGFQSLIERIPGRREVIILLDNNDSTKLLDIALEIRKVLDEKR